MAADCEVISQLSKARHTLPNADLAWWQGLLLSAEGKRLLHETNRATFHLFSDASSLGLDAFWYEGDPSKFNWREALPLPRDNALAQAAHINTLEVVAIRASLEAWARRWAHSTPVVYTDNTTALRAFIYKTVKGAETMAAFSASAQATLIWDTYRRTDLDVNEAQDRPQFFEAHGTGTPAGQS